ncbi:MAG: isoprenylcysteine carboxylmethyltransferase family protein [Sulfitobacter sp.]|nr:isoprenylcysteine carboxylmethyltransferase family protein [Sulfitobacter sp.]
MAWLFSVEAGTSRQASKTAASASDADERVVDTTTSRLFDVTAFAALSGGVATSLARPGASIPARRMSYLLGALILGGSGMLSASARQHLGRFHRDALTVHSDHELVDTGPYRRVRHPLYTATIGVFIGIGAVLGNWISVALTALPASALLRRIHVEEDMLIEALGPDYLRYRERTARLVPGLW